MKLNSIENKGAGVLILDLAAVIVENKAYLSAIDGKIGDGDHGINMAKGFGRAAGRLSGDETLDAAMRLLADVLMSEIGGSIGPLYGMMFANMADTIENDSRIDVAVFTKMLRAGLEGIRLIGSANVGDKTMLDALVPAVEQLEATVNANESFAIGLERMKSAAQTGRDSTIDMVARIGRSSRLGERSRGVLDAGATSCCLILSTFADSIGKQLDCSIIELPARTPTNLIKV